MIGLDGSGPVSRSSGGDSAGFKTSCLVAQPNLPIGREGAAEQGKVACPLISCHFLCPA